MTKQKRKLKRVRRDNFSVMCRAIGRYLEKHGWSVLVIGDAQIRSWEREWIQARICHDLHRQEVNFIESGNPFNRGGK